MRYGEGLLEEILRRTDLVQLVGRRIKLDRKGRVFWGLCPFHKEKSPSFKVENERRTYHCFGCGAGGDAFKWLTETEGMSFPEAVQKLAGEAGIELPAWSAEDEARETRKKSLYEIIELAAQFYEDQLHRMRSGDAARAYLQSRGLESAACKRFRLGYAPDGNSALRDHLIAKGVALPDMIEAGLVRAADENRGARDFFYDRVMFPIADIRGRIVAFGGRGLSADAKPKYINTGETPLFSKGHLLYNFKTAREAALKGESLIVAEGYMDVIALVEAGFAGAVAPLGTALTEDQLGLLWKVSPEPILCFDGDEAGLRAAKRASLLALPHLEPGQSLRFVFLPTGEDPDSFLRSQGAEPMRAALAKAQGLADMLWAGETEGRELSTPERRAGLEAELERLVRTIRDPKIADYYRRDFAERVFKAFKQRQPYQGKPRSEGRRSNFRPNFKQSNFGRPPAPAQDVSAAVKRSLHVVNALSAAKNLNERRLLALLICSPHLIDRYSEALAWLALDDPQLDRIRRELLNLAASGKKLDKAAVENHLVRQGLGVLVERLKTHSVLQSDLRGQADEEAREALWLRTRAQLADPDTSGIGDLKAQRDQALQRYLDGGSEGDWDELQRLNGEIRSSVEADGKRDGK
ncbi:MAG TPA: DNA primase [Micropepsaceae bacterium]|nr:DNA primase [Micropepsaceae bacterium]